MRGLTVTGVQTCALPIWVAARASTTRILQPERGKHARATLAHRCTVHRLAALGRDLFGRERHGALRSTGEVEIGRASGRERGEISVGPGSLKKREYSREH